MSINGFSSAVPLYSINTTQAVLGNGSLSTPSLRFSNASSTGFLLSNSNISISVSGVQAALFSPSLQTFTGQVNTGTLSANLINANSLVLSGGFSFSGNLSSGTWTPVMSDLSGNPFSTSASSGSWSRVNNLVLFEFDITTTSKSGTNGADTLCITVPPANIVPLRSGIVSLSASNAITYPSGAICLTGTVKTGQIQLRWLNLNQTVKVDNVAASGFLQGSGYYWLI